MLNYALRRVLWAIPTLIATSLVLFFVTTLAPDPAGFLDLPRFVNTDPQDVRSRAARALSQIGERGPQGAAAGAELCRLGGAALPYVLPLLETLAPEARGEVAMQLAPVAERMGFPEPERLRQSDTAVVFWTRFWEERALDFTRAAVGRAVGRLVEHGADSRERDLSVADTFALPEIMAAMATTRDHVALERLTRLARHATGRGPAVAPDDTGDDALRTVAEWQEWWFVRASDFVPLEGVERALAFVTDTRYGKWLERAGSGELGVSAVDGQPIARKLLARAPVTLLICGLAIAVSWAMAVPLGAFAAWRQGRLFDVVSSAALFVVYAVPTFAMAEVLRRMAGGQAVEGGRLALAVISLALGSLAALSRWQRAAMLEVVRQDFVRTAHAKGLPGLRVAVVHALRNALQPVIVLAGLHLPVLLGGALVVEEVFALPGVGFETLRAVEAHDTPWLMAVVLMAAVTVTVGLLASDVVSGTLDPRVREVLTARQRGETR